MTFFSSSDIAQSSFDEPFLELPRTWLIGALGAVVIHVASAAVLFDYMRDTTFDLGAPGLVVDVDLAAPHRDQDVLPVGPDAEASVHAPAVVEQQAEDANLPKDVPTDADNAERLVSREDVKRPDDQDPKVTAVQAEPSTASITAEDMAIPTVATARQSTASLTMSPGTGESAVRERVTWQKELAAHFDKYKRYPAERSMQAAEVVVTFVLDSVGHIVSSRIVKGSGDPAFDAAALAMLQRSDPVPAPPRRVADAGLSFTMPVIFQVKPQK